MDRRKFLQTGAVATVAGAASTTVGSCASTQNAALPPDDSIEMPDMDAYLQEVDDGVAKIGTWDFDGKIAAGDGEDDERLTLARRSLEALYMTAMFSDQSEVGQAHPGMQQRVLDAASRMGDTIAEMDEFLNSRTSSELADIQVALNDNPDLPMEMAELLNTYGKEFGLKPSRRLQVRSMVSQTALRMKAQSPGLVVNEYVNKVEKLIKRSGTAEEIKQQLIARMGEEEFFEKQRRMAMYAAAWDSHGARAQSTSTTAGATENPADKGSPIAGDSGVQESPEEKNDREDADAGVSEEVAAEAKTATHQKVSKSAGDCACCRQPRARLEKGDRLVLGGSWTMGIGVLIGAIGGAIFSVAWLGSMIMLTVGGVMLITGLIIVIVGAVMKKNAQKKLDAAHQ